MMARGPDWLGKVHRFALPVTILCLLAAGGAKRKGARDKPRGLRTPRRGGLGMHGALDEEVLGWMD